MLCYWGKFLNIFFKELRSVHVVLGKKSNALYYIPVAETGFVLAYTLSAHFNDGK